MGNFEEIVNKLAGRIVTLQPIVREAVEEFIGNINVRFGTDWVMGTQMEAEKVEGVWCNGKHLDRLVCHHRGPLIGQVETDNVERYGPPYLRDYRHYVGSKDGSIPPYTEEDDYMENDYYVDAPMLSTFVISDYYRSWGLWAYAHVYSQKFDRGVSVRFKVDDKGDTVLVNLDTNNSLVYGWLAIKPDHPENLPIVSRVV